MKSKLVGLLAIVVVVLGAAGCGGSDQPSGPAGESAASSQPAAASAKAGLQKIGDMADAWNELYKQNEAAFNDYEGMPIMELVTPATTFIGSVQFDLLNLDNADGHFTGKLMLAGYPAVMDRAGSTITFGYDFKREKDGFGPLAKAGDRMVENGSLDLKQGYYKAEDFTERGGTRIARSYHEFKRLGDGSMICLVFSGQAVDVRGDAQPSDSAIYIHNGKNRYDFVVAKGANGPAFTPISFADKGDLMKAQAMELFQAAGYTIDKSGGIQGGKLALDQ
ncbi:MAG: hypothetical protein GX414_06625 [Acidobacteria bacterium]|nr:hypothetical protein [Acidobacteriota bacterium]